MATSKVPHEYATGDLAELTGGGFQKRDGLNENVIILGKAVISQYSKQVYYIEAVSPGNFSKTYSKEYYPTGVPVYWDSLTPLPMEILGDNDDDCV